MSEGKLTKSIMAFLKANGWDILTFDYPQSGTGKNFKPSSDCFEETDKNKKDIIPDILAVKDGVMLLFENKTYFYFDDFQKVNQLIIEDCYEESLNEFLELLEIKINKKYYGIGCLDSKIFYKKAENHYDMTDFVINVNPNSKKVFITHNPNAIEF